VLSILIIVGGLLLIGIIVAVVVSMIK